MSDLFPTPKILVRACLPDQNALTEFGLLSESIYIMFGIVDGKIKEGIVSSQGVKNVLVECCKIKIEYNTYMRLSSWDNVTWKSKTNSAWTIKAAEGFIKVSKNNNLNVMFY